MKNYKPILLKADWSDIEEMAYDAAQTITYRHYVNGDSYDETRSAIAIERDILSKVMLGALLAIRWRDDAAQTALDTAEYIGDLLLPGINGYDSIYLPIKKILRELDPDNKEDTSC